MKESDYVLVNYGENHKLSGGWIPKPTHKF